MYIAMNRFRIAAGRESDFESVWRTRQSYLNTVAGFKEFHLLRGATENGVTLFASHSVWESRKAFEDWTNSDSFRMAHGQGRSPEGVVVGPPQFEGFDVVL